MSQWLEKMMREVKYSPDLRRKVQPSAEEKLLDRSLESLQETIQDLTESKLSPERINRLSGDAARTIATITAKITESIKRGS